MSFHKFMAFDPYLSFAEGGRGFCEQIFLKANGAPCETWYGKDRDGRGYLQSLWRVGRDAYAIVAERIGDQPKAEDFKDIAVAIKELEKELEAEVQQLIQTGRLTLHESRYSPPVTNLATTMEDAPAGWLLEVFMRYVRPSVISGDMPTDILPDFEGLLCGAAVMYVDDYIMAHQLASADLDFFYDLVQVNIASANLYRETVAAAKEAVSAAGRRSASARHKSTNQHKARLLAEWSASCNEYDSRADFARIIGKRDGIKERTLYEWIAAHEKSKG